MKSVYFLMIPLAFLAMSCKNNPAENSPMQQKVNEYAPVTLTTDYSRLSDNEKELITLFKSIGKDIDHLFWLQTFGDPSTLNIQDPATKAFVDINYGPWERLNNNLPFVEGYGEKPAGCTFYPTDMTVEEFEAWKNPDKNSLYTVVRRGEDGKLKTIWYHEEYKEYIDVICKKMAEAIRLADDPGLKNYLIERKKAFETDSYFESDLAWMEMKNSLIDFVVGPIENYDDALFEAKASYEAFILVKDVEESEKLAKFTAMLPDMQKALPCPPKYKTFVPGTSSDLNVYDAIYYAGDCNCGSKTIAINLPNDDRVQALKGSRRLQLKNVMQAKFDKIMLPIGKMVIEEPQTKHLKFQAFFWNVTFHEVTHGLGIKQTITNRGSVDDALREEKTSWEEAKADILGLFMVNELIKKGEITDITAEDAITTYIAGMLRSVRFGASSSHGKANMMCYNFMEDHGAFTRNADGRYKIHFDRAMAAVNDWANLIITTQGNGDYNFAKSFRTENGGIRPSLQSDLDKINNSGIPKDIRFIEE